MEETKNYRLKEKTMIEGRYQNAGTVLAMTAAEAKVRNVEEVKAEDMEGAGKRADVTPGEATGAYTKDVLVVDDDLKRTDDNSQTPALSDEAKAQARATADDTAKQDGAKAARK